MPAIITRDKWKFNSPYPIIEISEMIISNEMNGHASLWAKGTLNCGPDEIEEIRNGSNAGDEVSVVVDEGGETLFLGFSDNIKFSVVRDNH